MTAKRWLAVAMWLALLAATAAYVLLLLNDPEGILDRTGIFLNVIALVFGTTGLVLVRRVPGNRIGWIYLAAGVFGGLTVASFTYPGVAVAKGWPLAVEVAVISDVVYFPWILTMVSLPALLFPDGKLPSPRWRWVARAIVALYVLILLFGPVYPTITNDVFAGEPNPWAVDALVPFFQSAVWSVMGMSLLAVSLLGPVVALLLRFRRSVGVERLQLKWLAFSASVAVVGLGLTYALGGEGEGWLSVITVIGFIGVLSIPVTTGMAIVRYRLYEIDRLISRTLTYGLLAGLLAAVYAAGVFLVGTLAFDDGIGVALSTLAVAALVNPLRKQLQARIDRRFSRTGYDAEEVLDAFSRSVADQVDVDTLVDDLLEVVDETVVPEGAAVWVRQPRGAR